MLDKGDYVFFSSKRKDNSWKVSEEVGGNGRKNLKTKCEDMVPED